MNLFNDYDYDLAVRWGAGRPPLNDLFEAFGHQSDAFRAQLERFRGHADILRGMPLAADPERPDLPHWVNGFLPSLDILCLHGMLCEYKPKRFFEIGSGNSTKVAHHARHSAGLDLEILSIDPYPRADIDRLCDRIIRQPLEQVAVASFDQLEPGDILFFDGSHRVLQNSDVTVFFLEILPRIAPGVIVQIHDICIPYDYPAEWRERAYSEQYMLALLLQAAPEKWEVLCPNVYTTYTGIAAQVWGEFWDAINLPATVRHGGSFWMRKR